MPFIRPSTISRARRSIEPTFARVRGSRYLRTSEIVDSAIVSRNSEVFFRHASNACVFIFEQPHSNSFVIHRGKPHLAASVRIANFVTTTSRRHYYSDVNVR